MTDTSFALLRTSGPYAAFFRMIICVMTWIVGATSLYGYGALYSDVQVTFRGGMTRDLIQKAYPLSNFIAAGFSGSVRIGFHLLQSLSDCLRLPEEDLRTQAWDP